MYTSNGSAGLMQRPNVAQQFVQTFGGFGPHSQARFLGVGVRVEFNEFRDLIVAKVNDGGSAHRDGTIRVGDILLAVGQSVVVGKTLVQLRPFMIGPRGSSVTLTFKRSIEGTAEFSEFTIELVRGDNLFFLQAENQASAAKLQVFNQQNNEVEMEMNQMRGVLSQSQLEAQHANNEAEVLQTRYRQLQNAIDKCNGDIAEERQQHAALTDHLRRGQDENTQKVQIRTYHEQLTRVEKQLGEIMGNLESEHEESCMLVMELDQEQRVAGINGEKIRKHEGYVAAASQLLSSAEEFKAQRTKEIEHLHSQITAAEAAEQVADGDSENVRAAAGALQEQLAKAQEQRRELEGKLVDVRNTLTEADSEHTIVQNKGVRLFEKQDLVCV